jgi:hypothetical protein
LAVRQLHGKNHVIGEGSPFIRAFRTAWKSALAKARAKEYRFHDFRSTATHHMI